MPKASAAPAAAPAPAAVAPKKTRAEKLQADAVRDCRRLHTAAKDLQEGMMMNAPQEDLDALANYITQTNAAAAAAAQMLNLR